MQIASGNQAHAQLHTEAYRSGHNGPDSKSGSLHGLVGSNPTASAKKETSFVYQGKRGFSFISNAFSSQKRLTEAFLEYVLTRLLRLYIIDIYSIDRGDDVNILIDNKSGAPIYDQIYSQIKSQIISGALKEDEMLPSIRGLAKDLRISFITTKRAYEELEKDGFIYTLPGKGCYVAPRNVELLREENLKKIEEHIDEIVKLAASCNLSKKDIIEMVNFSLEEQG